MTTALIGTGSLDRSSHACWPQAARPCGSRAPTASSARRLAAEIGPAAVVAGDNRDALQGADAVVLALRFTALKGVIDEIADRLTDKLVVVPSNPLGTDAQGNVSRLLPEGQSSGEVIAGWLPAGARLAMAFGTLSADVLESSSKRSPDPAVLFYVTDDDRAGEEVERLIRTAGFEPVKAGGLEQSSRLEVGGDLHDLVVSAAEARSLAGDGLIASPGHLFGGPASLPDGPTLTTLIASLPPRSPRCSESPLLRLDSPGTARARRDPTPRAALVRRDRSRGAGCA